MKIISEVFSISRSNLINSLKINSAVEIKKLKKINHEISDQEVFDHLKEIINSRPS